MGRDEIDYMFDRNDEREAAEFAAIIRAHLRHVRCDECGYLLLARGHEISCGAVAA